jgi:hypothetical protein
VCLDRITLRKKVLKKDQKVYKRVIKLGEDQYVNYMWDIIKEYRYKLDINHADIKDIGDNPCVIYNSGFHCFSKLKDAINYSCSNRTEYRNNAYPLIVVSFIIPKGVEVLVGYDDCCLVIVSPKIINLQEITKQINWGGCNK